MYFHTSINQIERYCPVSPGTIEVLLRVAQGGTVPQPQEQPLRLQHSKNVTIPLLAVLDGLGAEDTLAILSHLPQYQCVNRLIGVWFAEDVRHLMTDPRSLEALYAAEWYAHGVTTESQLADARNNAWLAFSDASDRLKGMKKEVSEPQESHEEWEWWSRKAVVAAAAVAWSVTQGGSFVALNLIVDTVSRALTYHPAPPPPVSPTMSLSPQDKLRRLLTCVSQGDVRILMRFHKD